MKLSIIPPCRNWEPDNQMVSGTEARQRKPRRRKQRWRQTKRNSNESYYFRNFANAKVILKRLFFFECAQNFWEHFAKLVFCFLCTLVVLVYLMHCWLLVEGTDGTDAFLSSRTALYIRVGAWEETEKHPLPGVSIVTGKDEWFCGQFFPSFFYHLFSFPSRCIFFPTSSSCQ